MVDENFNSDVRVGCDSDNRICCPMMCGEIIFFEVATICCAGCNT